MKILANDGISPSGKEKLKSAGFSVVTEKVEQDQLADAINNEGYVGLLVRSATTVRKELIDQCPGLKIIGRGGVGMDNIDVEYAREKGLKVFNTPASSSQSVAELVIAQMFSLSRSLHDANRQMPKTGAEDFKALKKKYGKGTELRGKTLGIVGFGRIGRSLAQYALGCGMKVVAYDMYWNDKPVKFKIEGHGDIEVKVPFSEMDQLLENSDYISLHVPKQDDGQAVIGSEQLKKIKRNAILINASRGGVVDEDALLEAFEEEEIRYAALDVFENEPTPREDLLTHDKISATPHIGAATLEAQDRIGVELADNIIEALGESVQQQ
jgi:D-3-phosphoglycerate dehydrogenase